MWFHIAYHWHGTYIQWILWLEAWRFVWLFWQLWQGGASACLRKKHPRGGPKVRWSYSAAIYYIQYMLWDYYAWISPCSSESVSVPTDLNTGDSAWTPQCCNVQGDAIQQIDHTYSMIHQQPSHALHLMVPAISKLDSLESQLLMKVWPMCEYFRLFTQSLPLAGSLFRVSAGGILPTHNISALSKNTCKLCGQTLAAGIRHGAQSPMCSTQEAAHFLVHGTYLKRREEEMLIAIPDLDIQGTAEGSGYLLCLLSEPITYIRTCMHVNNK